jgi:hypothetical protein
LTSSLDAGDYLQVKTSRYPLDRSLVGPRAGLGAVLKKKIPRTGDRHYTAVYRGRKKKKKVRRGDTRNLT